jgi:hypothetical protein
MCVCVTHAHTEREREREREGEREKHKDRENTFCLFFSPSELLRRVHVHTSFLNLFSASLLSVPVFLSSEEIRAKPVEKGMIPWGSQAQSHLTRNPVPMLIPWMLSGDQHREDSQGRGRTCRP